MPVSAGASQRDNANLIGLSNQNQLGLYHEAILPFGSNGGSVAFLNP
jgi:hypothetical protein